MKIFALLLILVGVFAFGFAGQKQPEVPFQVLERGQNAGEKEQGLKVFRTQKAYDEYLKEHGQSPASRALKDVDWSKEQVVMVFGGEQPTGGYGVEVKRVVSTDVQRLSVEALLIRPRANTPTTQALTTPYITFKMARQVAVIRVKFVLE